MNLPPIDLPEVLRLLDQCQANGGLTNNELRRNGGLTDDEWDARCFPKEAGYLWRQP